MLKNFFQVAFRNMRSHKVLSFLNITGLAIGMSASFLVFLYVRFEWSYDKFNTRADRIYRLACDIKTPTATFNNGVTSPPMAVNIKDAFPEVEAVVRLSRTSMLVRKNNIAFQEEQAVLADSSLFRVFDFPLIYGDPNTALKEPFSVVLSEDAAKKYFGTANPVGQTVRLTDDNISATVTGVMKDIPENSQIRADLFLSLSSNKQLDPAADKQWFNFRYISYVLLQPRTDARALEAKFPALLEQQDGKEMRETQMYFSLFLEPLKDVYLHSKRGGTPVTGDINNVYIFSAIGLFILLIASINFINLTTARATERAKEVGIRKVIGAGKAQLIRQFLGESILICLIAFVLSLLLCTALLPLFNQLSGKTISTPFLDHPGYILNLSGIATAIGLLAGIYPSLVLSSFQPITVLKGRFASGRQGLLLRKGLVVTQFIISIVLIASTLVIYSQLRFMRSQDMGFSNQQTIVINTHMDTHKEAFRQEIARLQGVRSTTMSSGIPGSSGTGAYTQIENKKGEIQVATLGLYFVDFDFIPQYRMKMVAGRTFSRDFATDTSNAMILNETAVKLFGYTSPQQAIGRHFDQWGKSGTIVGVVKDFHFLSLKSSIDPLCLRIEPASCGLISVNVTTADVRTTIAAIGDKWKKVIPNRPFSYYFADEFFDRQYRSEDRFGRLFMYFAVLAIFISCLGLLGLTSYSTLQRTREIGIRKIMGAGIPDILSIVSSGFLRLVLIAFLIASPIAWYCMHQWLKAFAYRVDISGWTFAMTGFLSLFIAALTIGFHAIRAALANPVKNLRSE